MDILLWTLAGGILGWLSHSYLGFNEARGRILSIVIGAFGGVLGGKEVAPIFATATAGEFSMTALLFALAVATAFLLVSQLMSSHWNV